MAFCYRKINIILFCYIFSSKWLHGPSYCSRWL